MSIESNGERRPRAAPAPQPVLVYVEPVFGDGSICEISPGNGPSHSFVHGGIIHLHGHASFDVTWQLQPGTPADLQFDPDDPIWSSQECCPDDPCHDGQIMVTDLSPTTLVTTVTPQQPPNAVHVSLGWSNGVRFDPIMINN